MTSHSCWQTLDIVHNVELHILIHRILHRIRPKTNIFSNGPKHSIPLMQIPLHNKGVKAGGIGLELEHRL